MHSVNSFLLIHFRLLNIRSNWQNQNYHCVRQRSQVFWNTWRWDDIHRNLPFQYSFFLLFIWFCVSVHLLFYFMFIVFKYCTIKCWIRFIWSTVNAAQCNKNGSIKTFFFIGFHMKNFRYNFKWTFLTYIEMKMIKLCLRQV